MGTLSGGGKQQVSLGERCLLGANSGIGISLGDDCVVEAGLYLTAGTKVTLPEGQVVKARELSGQSGLLFLRNSVTGTVEVRSRTGTGVELNAALQLTIVATDLDLSADGHRERRNLGRRWDLFDAQLRPPGHPDDHVHHFLEDR